MKEHVFVRTKYCRMDRHNALPPIWKKAMSDYVSEGGYLFDKDTRTVKKLYNTTLYKRSITTSVDVIRYRILSLRCLVAIVKKKDISLFHHVPTDMHRYSTQFRKEYGKGAVLFYKLYFYTLLLKIQKHYTQFNEIIARINRMIPYRTIYTEYDRIFVKTIGIDPIWFGMLISLEIRIHTKCDRTISLNVIRSCMNDSINRHIEKEIDRSTALMLEMRDKKTQDAAKAASDQTSVQASAHSSDTVDTMSTSTQSTQDIVLANTIEDDLRMCDDTECDFTEHVTNVKWKKEIDIKNMYNHLKEAKGKTDEPKTDEPKTDDLKTEDKTKTVYNARSAPVYPSMTGVECIDDKPQLENGHEDQNQTADSNDKTNDDKTANVDSAQDITTSRQEPTNAIAIANSNVNDSVNTSASASVSASNAQNSLRYCTQETELRTKLDEQCKMNKQLCDYVNLLVREVNSLKQTISQNQLQLHEQCQLQSQLQAQLQAQLQSQIQAQMQSQLQLQNQYAVQYQQYPVQAPFQGQLGQDQNGNPVFFYVAQ